MGIGCLVSGLDVPSATDTFLAYMQGSNPYFPAKKLSEFWRDQSRRHTRLELGSSTEPKNTLQSHYTICQNVGMCSHCIAYRFATWTTGTKSHKNAQKLGTEFILKGCHVTWHWLGWSWMCGWYIQIPSWYIQITYSHSNFTGERNIEIYIYRICIFSHVLNCRFLNNDYDTLWCATSTFWAETNLFVVCLLYGENN